MLVLFLLGAVPLVQGQFDALLKPFTDACASTNEDYQIGLIIRYHEVVNGQLEPAVCSGEESTGSVISGAVYCHLFSFPNQFFPVFQGRVPKGVVLFIEKKCGKLEVREEETKACNVPGTSEILSGKKDLLVLPLDLVSLLVGREDSTRCFNISCKENQLNHMYFTPNAACEECPTNKAPDTYDEKLCNKAKKKDKAYCKKCVKALNNKQKACDLLESKNKKECKALLKQCKKKPVENPTNKKCNNKKNAQIKKQCKTCVKAINLDKNACNSMKKKNIKNSCDDRFKDCTELLEKLI